jgi:glycine/D-amino acid oxidase-like deaminating enzyme
MITREIFRSHRKDRHLRVFTRTRVVRVKPDNEEVTIRTSRGCTVRAKFLIVAAGYESGRFLKSELVHLHSTYVIASPPFEKLPFLGGKVMWETARPYFYLRTTADNRIVFGGLDERFADARRRDRLLPRKRRELEKQFATLFPAFAFRSEFAWTGTFAETRDGLPCIGPANLGPRVLFALGYGGNGITFSQIAAKILRDYCTGRENRDARIFRFDRTVNARRDR